MGVSDKGGGGSLNRTQALYAHPRDKCCSLVGRGDKGAGVLETGPAATKSLQCWKVSPGHELVGAHSLFGRSGLFFSILNESKGRARVMNQVAARMAGG